jgi:hypothetical protein
MSHHEEHDGGVGILDTIQELKRLTADIDATVLMYRQRMQGRIFTTNQEV